MIAKAKSFSFPDDGTLIRGAFYVMLAICAVVLFLDAKHLAEADPIVERVLDNPIPPAVKLPERTNPDEETLEPYSPNVKSAPKILRQNLQIRLAGNNQLVLTGAIDIGSAERFANEVESITEYVETVVLNSPGGSVTDALEISKLIREKEWTTKVETGGLCASACPLIFAGGVERIADNAAAIGVHQIYSAREDRRSVDQAVSGTQSSTASIVRHLEKMGVDPKLWTHALETAPQHLYYFRPEELEKYNLVSPKYEN